MTTGQRKWARIAAFVAGGLAVALIALFALRIPIAEALAEAYFTSEGAPAEVHIEHWDRGELVAQIKLGAGPDFTADRVTLALDPQYWLPHVESVSIASTRAHVYFDGRSISFGPLQRLVDNLTAKRKTKNWTDQFIKDPLPVTINDARVTLDTPAGPTIVTGQFEALGPQILSAEARVVQTELRRGNVLTHIDEAAFSGRWKGNGFDGNGVLSVKTEVREHSGATSLQAFHATVAVRGLRAGTEAGATHYSLHSLTLHADAAGGFSNLLSNAAAFAVQFDNLEGQFERGRLAGSSKVSASIGAENLRIGTTPIDRVRLAFDGNAWISGGRTTLEGRLSGSSGLSETTSRALTRSLPVFGSDAHLIAAVSTALRALNIDSHLRVARDDYVLALSLLPPTTVTSNDGASLVLTPVRDGEATLAISEGGIVGASNVRLRGGGLPSVNLVIDSFSLQGPGEFGIGVRGSISATTTALRNATISAAAQIAGKDHSFNVVLKGCADARVGTVLAGQKPAISDGHARFCTLPGQPVVSGSQHEWKFASNLSAISGTFSGALTKFEGAHGHAELIGGASGLETGAVDFAGGKLTDLFSSRRFEPLSVSGNAKLTDGVWRGSSAIRTAGQKKQLGVVRFSHVLSTGIGKADIDAHDIVFVPNKFAPADISPLLTAVARADGKASFTGHIGWTPHELKSEGQLDVDGLQFASPIGPAHGTTTHIHFVSLLPPETAPNQLLEIEHIEWMSPLNGVSADFRLTPGAIEVGGASAKVAGGTATVDPLTISFSNRNLSGVLKLSEVDLGTFLEGSNLATKIHVQARLSGTIPFAMTPEGIRIKDGFIAATKPGRISIDRSLWTSGAQLSSNAMQDFAYQAMENLAFDRLQGKINSLPGGRLGLVLHIEGRNDPPKPTEAKVGLFALLRGEAFKKPMALPKGTPIDLTLDTSLNFDELLRAYQSVRSPSVEVKSR